MRALELHAHTKVIQRSKGRSSVAAAAYRAAVELYDERTGLTHDYTRKQGVEFSRIYIPENAPQNFKDRETLWNAVEKKENRSNSCTARELEVAFPFEFNAMQRREAGDSISRELMSRYGCAVDIAFHEPNMNGNERNYHAHILFTDRSFDPSTKDGWSKNKYRDLSNDKIIVNDEKTTRGQQEVLSLREFTAGVMNRISKRDDLSITVEHLSFEARGIDQEPQIHLGSVANDMNKKGSKSERGEQNKKIIELNKKRKELDEEVTFDRFDEFAGAKRAEFQSWDRDERIVNDRRCETERRKLERELDDFYGADDRAERDRIKVIENEIKQGGVRGIADNIIGVNDRRREDIKDIKRSLADSENRKNERRASLAKEQKERLLNMEKRHNQIEKEMEEEIEKARSSFKEDDEEGRGDQGQPQIVKKVKRSLGNRVPSIPAKEYIDRAKKAQKKRTTSYSGKDMTTNRKRRLKDNHKDAVDTKVKSGKKRRRTKPEHDYTPPRSPSLGR